MRAPDSRVCLNNVRREFGEGWSVGPGPQTNPPRQETASPHHPSITTTPGSMADLISFGLARGFGEGTAKSDKTSDKRPKQCCGGVGAR